MSAYKLVLVTGESGFVLTPDGSRIDLPYLKTAELLYMLAEAPSVPQPREELAKRLWPASSRSERMASLRQAIARIRRLLGSGSIHADRTTCGLNICLHVQPGTGVLITPREESISRTASASQAPEVDTVKLKSLDYFRDHPEEALRLDPQTLRQLVDRLSRTNIGEDQAGWITLWRAIARVSENPAAANGHLKISRKLALESQDWSLFSLSTYWLGIVAILQGQVGSAERIAKHSSDLLEFKSLDFLPRVSMLRAHAYLHGGNVDGALQLLERSERSEAMPERERATSIALRGVYSAYQGQVLVAEQLVERLQPYVESSTDYAIRDYVLLTRSIIETMYPSGESLARAEEVAESFGKGGNFHLELYARELLQVRAKSTGRKTLYSSQSKRVQNLRTGLGLRYSRWDYDRLGLVS